MVIITSPNGNEQLLGGKRRSGIPGLVAGQQQDLYTTGKSAACAMCSSTTEFSENENSASFTIDAYSDGAVDWGRLSAGDWDFRPGWLLAGTRVGVSRRCDALPEAGEENA
jgi:hypothetical protein